VIGIANGSQGAGAAGRFEIGLLLTLMMGREGRNLREQIMIVAYYLDTPFPNLYLLQMYNPDTFSASYEV
jgi:hypothetical protein